MGLFKKYRSLEMHQHFLAPPTAPYAFFGQAPSGCHKDELLPRQPTDCRRSDSQKLAKYVADTASGPAADRLTSENTTRRVLREATDRILSEHTGRALAKNETQKRSHLNFKIGS